MTWNPAVPAGTDLVSQGDDVIREFKLDVQTALVATEGAPLSQDAGAFPGADPANPKYHYRGLKGTTADRPAATHYGLYFNTTTGTIQRSNGTTWEDVGALGPGTGNSTDNAIARFDGTDGQIQNSGVILDDANNVTGINDLEVIDDIDIGGGVTITGTSGHSVTSEFANECWEEVTRPTGSTVGLRGIARSSAGGVIGGGTSFSDIGVSCTLTTVGRRIFVGLRGTATQGYIRCQRNSAGGPVGIEVRLLRDGTEIYITQLNCDFLPNVNDTISWPVTSIWHTDEAGAGTYTYTCEIRGLSGVGNMEYSIIQATIVAYEL